MARRRGGKALGAAAWGGESFERCGVRRSRRGLQRSPRAVIELLLNQCESAAPQRAFWGAAGPGCAARWPI